MTGLEQVAEHSVQKHDGPFVQALDGALASFNVHRQAYYVHRTLKVKNMSNENL